MGLLKLGAVVWRTTVFDRALAFYRALGLPLEPDTHGEPGGPTHFECDYAGVHYGLYEVEDDQESESHRTMVGFQVTDLDAVLAAVRPLGAPLLVGPQDVPWGRRVVLEDPDGRRVEVWESAPGAGA